MPQSEDSIRSEVDRLQASWDSLAAVDTRASTKTDAKLFRQWADKVRDSWVDTHFTWATGTGDELDTWAARYDLAYRTAAVNARDAALSPEAQEQTLQQLADQERKKQQDDHGLWIALGAVGALVVVGGVVYIVNTSARRGAR
jgi:hypothetical protein